MPFDPTKPANNSPVSSSELRSQFNELKTLIDNIPPMEVSQGQLDDAISQIRSETSHDVTDIEPLNRDWGDPQLSDMALIAGKLDDLIEALKRE